MKKSLIYLLVFLTSAFAFTACSDDDDKELKPEVPPTVTEIAKTYTAGKLNAQLNSTNVQANAAVDVVVNSDNSVSFKLTNIIPGVRSFTIPNLAYDVKTRSIYYSALSGSIVDNVLGYSVSAEGRVYGDTLTIAIKQSEINGETGVSAKMLRSLTIKGNMNVDATGTPLESVQRVYTASPRGNDTTKLKLEIRNFELLGTKLGTITLDTVQIVKRGEVYGLVALNRKMTFTVGEVTIDARGGFTQNGTNTSLKLYLAINTGAGIVYADFIGEALVESTNTTAAIKITGPAIIDTVAFNGSLNLPKYTFKVWEDTPASQLLLTPVITIPEGATLDSINLYNADNKKVQSLEKDAAIDFSKVLQDYYVGYHVTAQDVRKTSLKKLFINRLPVVTKFDMSEWVDDGNGQGMLTPKGLNNSNIAAMFFPMFGIDVPTPVVKANDNAAEITSSRTVSTTIPNVLIPGVTAGTMFVGDFIVDISNTLKSTHFGTAHKAKPETFKFTYKYTPGTTYYKTVVKDNEGEAYNDTELVPNGLDSCSISAYLYEVDNYDEYLDGTNINTSSKVILKASFVSGAKSSYDTQELTFKETGNGSYSPSKLYKIAIVCSSSKRGDEFMGADGSKLWVKYLEVK